MVEFNQHSILNDPSIFPEPSTFNPERFLHHHSSSFDESSEDRKVNGEEPLEQRKVTDLSPSWPFWGVPRYQCPGRFYVSSLEKLLAVFVLQRFDARIEDGDVRRGLNLEWRDARVPREGVGLLMRRRG